VDEFFSWSFSVRIPLYDLGYSIGLHLCWYLVVPSHRLVHLFRQLLVHVHSLSEFMSAAGCLCEPKCPAFCVIVPDCPELKFSGILIGTGICRGWNCGIYQYGI
jgi:hypothetical protein